ncbi:class I glutamine amidotransferase-like protein [Thozetella sp. PMI_491]|nr:class I glutamine amidotransferase-like protein [Thozetella sp. PMI_491]
MLSPSSPRSGLTWSLCLLGLFASLASASPGMRLKRQEDGANITSVPLSYGMVLFQGFDMVDIFGPLDVLQLHARAYQLNLSLLAATMDPVTTEPFSAAMNPLNSSFWPTLPPTHTFDNAPPLDVLIVPGGPGARNPDLQPQVDFIKRTYPTLQYLISICTGAGVAARAGVLDGKRVTTNKAAWATITAMGPDVKWVAPARWVVDGNIWPSSGVTAGLDLTYRFIETVYPTGTADTYKYSGLQEYEPITNSSYDPFAARFNVSTQNQL